MRKVTIVAMFSIILLLMALPILVGCDDDEETPTAEATGTVTAEPTQEEDISPIEIATLWLLTGPYSTSTVMAFDGFMDYIDYVNEQGGIGGAKISNSWVDTKLDASVALSSYKQMRGKGIVLVNTVSSSETTAIKTLLEEDKIPCITTAAGYDLFVPPSWIYTQWYTMPTSVGGVATWLHEQWDEDRPMKAAILAWDIPMGRGMVDPVKRWMESAGIEVVAEEWVSPATLDYTLPLLRIKDAEPDMILTGISGAAPGLICRDAADIELSIDIPIITEQAGISSAEVVEIAEENIAYLMGGQGVLDMTLDADNEKVKFVQQLHDQYQGEGPVEFNYAHGVNHASIMVEAIKRAVESVGLENLDGAAVKEALDTIVDWDGGMLPTISYGDYEGDRIAGEKIRVVQYDYEQGAIISVSDWFNVNIALFAE